MQQSSTVLDSHLEFRTINMLALARSTFYRVSPSEFTEGDVLVVLEHEGGKDCDLMMKICSEDILSLEAKVMNYNIKLLMNQRLLCTEIGLTKTDSESYLNSNIPGKNFGYTNLRIFE
jgi:hypothetical protein